MPAKRGRTMDRGSQRSSRSSRTSSSQRSSTQLLSSGSYKGATATRSWPGPQNWNHLVPNPFRAKDIVKMKYCTQVNFNPALLNAASHIFRANSIFDPDFTGSGGQPYGHDQYQAIYTSYRVLKSTIRCTWGPGGLAGQGGSHQGCGYTVALQPTTNDPTDSLYGACINGARTTMAGNTDRPVNVFQSYDSKSIEYDGQSADFGTNPDNEVYFRCTRWSPNGTDLNSIIAVIQIEYTVELTKPKYLGVS